MKRDEDLIDQVIDLGIEIFFKCGEKVEYLVGRVFVAMVAIFILMALLKNWRFFT